MNPIKVVIIDDNKSVRSLVKEVLEMEEDIELCGEAATLQEARDVLLKCRPDIAILDISLDGAEGGLSFLEEIAALNLPTQSIILSAYDEANYSGKSLKAGAKGYVCKDKVVGSLTPAIRSVYSGKEFVSA